MEVTPPIARDQFVDQSQLNPFTQGNESLIDPDGFAWVEGFFEQSAVRHNYDPRARIERLPQLMRLTPLLNDPEFPSLDRVAATTLIQLTFKYRRLLQGLEPIPSQSDVHQELLTVTGSMTELCAHPNWQAGIQVWQGGLQQQIEDTTPLAQSTYLQTEFTKPLSRLKGALLEINASTADLYWLLKTLTDLRSFLIHIPSNLHTQYIQSYPFDSGWNPFTQYHKLWWICQTSWFLANTDKLEVEQRGTLRKNWCVFIDDAKCKMDTILQKHPITDQKKGQLLNLFSTAVCSLFPTNSNTGPLQQWLQRTDEIPFADVL